MHDGYMGEEKYQGNRWMAHLNLLQSIEVESSDLRSSIEANWYKIGSFPLPPSHMDQKRGCGLCVGGLM